MQYTTHYNLNLPEGTDIVNPLVQDNPNYSAIDAAMFANKQAVIGTASEVVSGTVHAITRANPDSNYFKFTATGNWTAGDSMSVDGTTVSVYLSDGTTPATGAYIINTEVLALLAGSRVTLIVSSGAVDASNVSYDNSVSGLIATNVQDAIDEVAPKGSASVIADGLKTYSAILDDLFALIDQTKINAKSVLDINNGNAVFAIKAFSASNIYFYNITATSSSPYLIATSARLRSSSSLFFEVTSAGVQTDYTGSVPPAGSVFKVIY